MYENENSNFKTVCEPSQVHTYAAKKMIIRINSMISITIDSLQELKKALETENDYYMFRYYMQIMKQNGKKKTF